MIAPSLVDYLPVFVVSTWLVDFISLIDMEWNLILILFKSQKNGSSRIAFECDVYFETVFIQPPLPLNTFHANLFEKSIIRLLKLTAHCCRKSS